MTDGMEEVDQDMLSTIKRHCSSMASLSRASRNAAKEAQAA